MDVLISFNLDEVDSLWMDKTFEGNRVQMRDDVYMIMYL